MSDINGILVNDCFYCRKSFMGKYMYVYYYIKVILQQFVKWQKLYCYFYYFFGFFKLHVCHER